MELQFLQFRRSTSLVSYATNGAQPSIDLFASKFSRKLPYYLSLVPDPEAICIDAFSFSWTTNMYAFPQLPLISRVVNKLVSDEASNFVLITPAWPGCMHPQNNRDSHF